MSSPFCGLLSKGKHKIKANLFGQGVFIQLIRKFGKFSPFSSSPPMSKPMDSNFCRSNEISLPNWTNGKRTVSLEQTDWVLLDTLHV